MDCVDDIFDNIGWVNYKIYIENEEEKLRGHKAKPVLDFGLYLCEWMFIAVTLTHGMYCENYWSMILQNAFLFLSNCVPPQKEKHIETYLRHVLFLDIMSKACFQPVINVEPLFML